MNTKNTISTNRKSESRNYHGFTLVELIVVITILVILGTIAFVSLGGYSGSARDSSRVSDLANLSKGLDIAYARSSAYPSPDNAFSVTYSGGILWYQGTIGDSVTNMISSNGAKMSKKPTDPLNTKEYTYSRLAYGNGYQIKSDWEGDTLVYKNSPKIFWIEEASAASGNPTLTYIKGNYNGLVVKTQSGSTLYLLAAPSLITSQTGTTGQSFDIISNLMNKLFVHGQTNSGGVTYTAKLAYASGSLPSTESERVLFANGIALAYSGTVLASQTNIQPFITAVVDYNTGTLASLGGGVVTSVGGSAGAASSSVSNATCGTANKTYLSTDTNFGSDTFCSATSSALSGPNPIFPVTAGTSVNWTCDSTSGWTNVSCTATREAITSFTLSQTSVTVGTSVTISHNCTIPPTSYTSSNTIVATISTTTISTASAGTTNITPVGGNCSDTSAKILTVATPPPVCGSTVDCYTIAQYTSGVSNSTTITTNGGKSLILRQSTSGFKYWQDSSGTNKILAANGLDAGGPNGDGWAGINNYNATPILAYMTTGSTLEWRTKPNHVYVGKFDTTAAQGATNMVDRFNTTQWLYYDAWNAAQTLDVNMTTNRVTGFTTWSPGTIGINSGWGKWFSGNVQKCQSKGMRLPVLYEINKKQSAWTNTDYMPVGDGAWQGWTCSSYPDSLNCAPGIGVPAYVGSTWTASSFTNDTGIFLNWSPIDASPGCNYYFFPKNVRCVSL